MNKQLLYAVSISAAVLCQGAYGFVRETKAFFSAYLRDPSGVASIIPSSRFLSNAMSKYVVPGEKPLRILELGAGAGPITEKIIEKMGPNDFLDVIEIDPELCEVLQEKFGHHTNVRVLCMSMFDWEPPYKYDLVISAIPHNTFDPDFVGSILQKYQDLIKSGGILTYVELAVFSRLKRTFLFGKNRARIREIFNIMKNFRKKFEFDKDTVLLNIPPAHAFHLRIEKE